MSNYSAYPIPTSPTPPSQPATRGRSSTGTGLAYAGAFVVLIWAVHLINVFLGGALHFFGIQPLDVSSLWHILTAPWIHADFAHLMSNTVPGAIFAFLIGRTGSRVWWEVTAFVVAVGGLGIWFFGGPGTNHFGASILVYGWLAYLIVRGVFNRSASQLALGVTLGFIYSSLIWGVLPGMEGVSWQGHLFGAIGGIAAGALITSDDPPALQARKRNKALQK